MKIYTAGSDLFNGILKNERESYDITSTGENVGDYRYEYLVDGKYNTYSCTVNSLFTFYEFSFKNEMTVKIKQYSIRTRTHNDVDYPKSWVLSGFNGKKWLNVSTVIESNMNGQNIMKLFDTSFVFPFSIVRITQVGVPYREKSDFYYFCMAGIDFFGSLGFHRSNFLSCKNSSMRKLNMYFLVLLFLCIE